MVDTQLTNSRIVTEYRNRTPKSADLKMVARRFWLMATMMPARCNPTV